MLYTEDPERPELKTFEFDAEKKELIIRFVFDIPEDKKAKYEELNDKAITTWLIGNCQELVTVLLVNISSDPKKQQNLLQKHLRSYVAKNTFDYFIHKDLKKFLSRELDFFIKNEVMHLDDVDTTDEKRVDTWLAKVRAIKRVGHVIIDFLASIEGFQKKLWLKKKFVVQCDYCITLDRIPESFHKEIAQNIDQWREWEYIVSHFEVWVYPRHCKIESHNNPWWKKENIKGVHILSKVPYFDISSSEIRNKNQSNSF
jgi:adenine-specific DNA-methyltransferase